MRVTLVVDDVFEVYSSGALEIVEELLVEDVRQSTDLIDAVLGCCSAVHEVGRYCNRHLASEQLPSET